MKRLWLALVAATMATGLAFAAGDAEKPSASSSDAPAAAHRTADFDPSRLPAMLQQNESLIARWEDALGRVHGDEAKKVLGEAIATGKEVNAELQQLSDAVKSGKDDEVRRLTAQFMQKRLELLRYATVMQTYMDLDQTKAQQAERGKDNADLNAHFQRMIDLLNKRLDLLNQVSAVNGDIWKERQALQQASESATGNAPAAETTKSEPKSTATQ